MTRLSSIPANSIAVWCSCGHSGVVPVRPLLAVVGDMTVREAVDRMRCTECGLRGEIQHMRIIYDAGVNALRSGHGQSE